MHTSQKSTYGLVGYPVSHSLSPAMHNAAFLALGVDAAYTLFPLKEHELAHFFAGLKQAGSPIFGLNVTIPYKETVLSWMDALSPFAAKVGAVNTVVISGDRKLTGHNTDGPGFLTHLAELGFNPAGKRIALLGAGGAARALISVLCLVPERPEWVRVYDVDQEKTGELLADCGLRFDISPVEVAAGVKDLDIGKADLLINATPVGMKPGDPCLVEASWLHADMLVYDLIYNPGETPLLTMARARGAQAANGLGMLFYQGVLAFQHWADIELDQDVKDRMRSALTAALP